MKNISSLTQTTNYLIILYLVLFSLYLVKCSEQHQNQQNNKKEDKDASSLAFKSSIISSLFKDKFSNLRPNAKLKNEEEEEEEDYVDDYDSNQHQHQQKQQQQLIIDDNDGYFKSLNNEDTLLNSIYNQINNNNNNNQNSNNDDGQQIQTIQTILNTNDKSKRSQHQSASNSNNNNVRHHQAAAGGNGKKNRSVVFDHSKIFRPQLGDNNIIEYKGYVLDFNIADAFKNTRICAYGEVCRSKYKYVFDCICPLNTLCSGQGRLYEAKCNQNHNTYVWVQRPNGF